MEENVHKGRKQEGWRGVEESKTPGGTVKRIHNGDATLASFNGLM